MAVMRLESHNPTASPCCSTSWWTPRLAGPVVAAAAVRLGLLAATIHWFGTSALTRGDTASYLEPGRNLLLHGRFFADGVPDLLRTPGYPLFLAVTSLGGLSAAAVANVLLSVFSVVLVWRLGRTAFGDNRIALAAAWIFAFEPLSVTCSAILLSDTLFLALFLLSLEPLAAFLRERRLPVLATAGLWLAAATFVRPVTYYLPVALAAGLFFVLARVPGLRWKAPAVLLISILPWLAAWQIRNWVETGYGGFSSASEVNLYFLAAPNVTAHLEHRPFLDVRDALGYVGFAGNSGQSYLFQPYLERNPQQAGWSQGQRLAFMRAKAAGILRAHPGLYLRLCFKSLSQPVFNPSGGSSFEHPLNPGDPARSFADYSLARRWTVLLRASPGALAEKALFGAILLGLYLFAARGVFLAARGSFGGDMCHACLWLLLGTSLYLLGITAAMGGSGGGSRYRLPVMPVVCIFAAAGALRAKTIAR